MNVFDPTIYSEEENKFLKENIGKPTIVALQELRPPVNVKAVKPVLDRINELQDLEKHSNETWAGVAAVKQAIETFLLQTSRWASDKRRGRPRFPSLHSYDTKGKPHRGGPGSDSKLKTYFDDKGERVPFALELIPSSIEDWTPDWNRVADVVKSAPGIKVDGEKNRIECLVCGHTESFNAESRASFNAARGRISKHLRTSIKEPERHKEVHAEEFAS